MQSTKIADVDQKGFCGYWFGMNPDQCRAARAWLNLTQGDLASASGVGLSTLKDYESGKRTPIGNNLSAIQAALESRGIRFLDADGNAYGITFTPVGKQA